MQIRLSAAAVSAQVAREHVVDSLIELGRPELADDATLVAAELMANGVMHARTDLTLSIEGTDDGIRIGVTDLSHLLPRWTPRSPTAISGRGLLLVDRLSARWGVEPLPHGGKTVWAELDRPADVTDEHSVEDLLEMWSDEPWPAHTQPLADVEVWVDIDVGAMLESRAHTEDLLRELQLSLLDPGSPVSAERESQTVLGLAQKLFLATDHFVEPRRQIYNQTVSAAKQGLTTTTLHLTLCREDAEAARGWLDVLDEADALTAAGVLLLPPFPERMTRFRRTYISAIISQLETGG